MSRRRGKTERKTLSRQVIKDLKPPETGRYYLYDWKQPGLCICVSQTGGKVFYLYKKVERRPERIRLGRWPEINVVQARDMAREIIGQVASGGNPVEERRTARMAPTLRSLFDEFIQLPTRGKAKRPKSPSTIAGYRQCFSYLADWENRRLSQIRRQDVEVLHNGLAVTSGKYTANRVLTLLKTMFNTAVDVGYIEANCLRTIRAFEEESRERFLQADELAQFLAAVRADPSDVFRDFVLLALFTGQRKTNVLSMKWEHVELGKGVWSMPETKTGKHQVPLVPEAIEILVRRKQHNGASEYVLPGRRPGSHLVSINDQWKALCRRAGITDLRIHDLRRTHGSWQAITGASLQVVGRTLGHRNPETTAIYSRLSDDPVRLAMATATRAMMDAAGQTQGADNGR